MHTICTQFAHTQTQTNIYAAHRTEHRHLNTEQDTEQHTETDTEQRTEYSTYDLHKYSFDFYHLQQYIKKLYNTAIYKLYTHYIHFARLIDEVSK